jgi:WD40 repeat protein
MISRRGNRIASLAGHQGWVTALQSAGTGQQLISGSTDRRVKVWDLGARQCVDTIQEHQDTVNKIRCNTIWIIIHQSFRFGLWPGVKMVNDLYPQVKMVHYVSILLQPLQHNNL